MLRAARLLHACHGHAWSRFASQEEVLDLLVLGTGKPRTKVMIQELPSGVSLQGGCLGVSPGWPPAVPKANLRRQPPAGWVLGGVAGVATRCRPAPGSGGGAGGKGSAMAHMEGGGRAWRAS